MIVTGKYEDEDIVNCNKSSTRTSCLIIDAYGTYKLTYGLP